MLSRSAPPPPAGTVRYFAYGANTASSTLARRGVQVLTSRPAVLVDPGTVISFQHRGGFATLTKAPPEQEADPRLQRGSVHGVVYSLSRTDMAALQRAETGYTLATVRVSTYPPTAACASTATTYDSNSSVEGSALLVERVASTAQVSDATSQDQAVTATAFVSRPGLQLRHPVPPTERYLELLQAGAQEHGLDPEYVAWLATVPSTDRTGLPPAYVDTQSNVVAQGDGDGFW